MKARARGVNAAAGAGRRLDRAIAERLARIALSHIERPWPYSHQQVLTGPHDLDQPAVLHPIFFGSFDWHSAVHSHWLLTEILRRYPRLAAARAIRARFERAFTVANVEKERAYFDRPGTAGFERPYGWAWLLALDQGLGALGHESAGWASALAPLSATIAARFEAWLPKAEYPVRAGTHGNTAFALSLALAWARARDEAGLVGLIEARARAWHLGDRDCQAWEPGGDDFLSGALAEAELMRRVLPETEFRPWFGRFLPRAASGEPSSLFLPARVSDRKDGKIAHLDGYNLSRAWCWRSIAAALAPDDPARAAAFFAANRLLEASLAWLDADYMGGHWLASFALLALTAP